MGGLGKAACQVSAHRLSRLIAGLMNIVVHLFYLGGIDGRRIDLGVTMVGGLFGSRHGRVIEGELQGVERPEETPNAGSRVDRDRAVSG